MVPYLRGRRQRSLPPGEDGKGGVGTLERPDEPAGGVDTLAPPELAEPDVAAPQEAAPPDVAPVPGGVIEKPPPSAGRLARLRSRLARSQNAFGNVLLNLLSSGKLDDQAWDEIEDTLITADMGIGPARQLVEQLRTEVKVVGTQDPAAVRGLLRADLIGLLGPDMDRSLHIARHGDRPSVVLIVGVNGTGKTPPAGSWPAR